MLVRTGAGCTHVHWAVDARKLKRRHGDAVSPGFMVELPGLGPTPFKIMLCAKSGLSGAMGGVSSGEAKRLSQVVLKCESQLPESCTDIAFRIGVGREDVLQPFRGPCVCSFYERSCHGLPAVDAEWNFSTSIDDSETFLVTLEVASKAAFLTNPNIWWAAFDTVVDAA